MLWCCMKLGTRPHIPVVVPPPHHVLIVGCGRDLKPLDVFIGAKKEGVVSRCVVRRPNEKTAHLTNYMKQERDKNRARETFSFMLSRMCL